MSSLDSDGFFNKGVMCDTFKTSGKEPDSKEIGNVLDGN